MGRGNYGHLIIFKDGKRIDKRIHVTRMREAVATVKNLKEKGYKAHLAYGTDARMYPSGDIEGPRGEGMWWCPYCGSWRWFKIPKANNHAELNSREWFLNSLRSQEIKVCAWCEISEMDWYVKRANGLFGLDTKHRRRRSRTPRKRVSRNRQ